MTNTSLGDLRSALEATLADDGRTWLTNALSATASDASAIRTLFPAAGRAVGHVELAGYTSVDVARILLLDGLGASANDEIPDLYRFGDAGERRSILLAYNVLPLGDGGLDFVRDALRSNDIRLVVAALGGYALDRLDDVEIYNAVLKCIFMEIPLRAIVGLSRRVTPPLSRMVASFVHERIAAGRDVNAELWPIIDAFPPASELKAIEAELQSLTDDRRHAAERALALRPVR
jgi:hypothetical protein